MVSSNIILIVVAFSVAVAAIYALYSIILFQGGGSKGDELQLSTKNILEQVDILYSKQEYALVELLATKYLERVPGHTDVRRFLAKACLEERKYNLAIKQCGIILNRYPNDYDTHYVLGRCYIRKKFLNKAIDEFSFLYEKNKSDKDIVRTLADLYTETEQYHMAISMYQELVALMEDQAQIAEVQSIIAELNEIVHDYPAAFEAYKSRLQILPKDVDTNKKLVILYIKISNYQAAIDALLTMLSFVTEPQTLKWIFETLVDLYEQIGDYEKAVAYAEKLLDINGTDKFKIRDRIADFNLKLGKLGDGILILEDLVLMSQNAFDVTIELANAYLINGEFEKALEKYCLLLDKATQKEAKQLNTLIAELYIKWSLPETSAGHYDKAMEYLNAALQYSPINCEVFHQIAINYYEQRQYANAVEYVNKAIVYDKESKIVVPCLLLLSMAHHELGNFFEEKKALTDLLKADEKNSEGLLRLGLMYVQQHDIKSAEDYFKKSIASNPENIQAKYNLALIYENSNKERAKELYVEVLEQDPTFIEAKNALTDLSTSE